MIAENPWCIIVNLKTCNARAWKAWQKFLQENNVRVRFHFTQSISEVSNILADQISNGQKRFLFAGGDGSLHHGGNLLIHLAGDRSHEMIVGVLPCGTGNDWFRTYGLSKGDLIASLQQNKSAPLHLLKLEWPDGTHRYAFNMVGGALDAAVVDYIDSDRFQFAGFLKYPIALIGTLMKPHIWIGEIIVDGKSHTGNWLSIQAGFGKYCGGGMYVLPHAEPSKAGVLLMRPKSIFKLLTSLPKLYNGKIADQKKAIAMHFSTIEINHTGDKIPLEADGEWLGHTPVTITTVMGLMKRLV